LKTKENSEKLKEIRKNYKKLKNTNKSLKKQKKARKKLKILEKSKKSQKRLKKPTFGPPKGHSLQELFLNMLECYCLAFFASFSSQHPPSVS